MAAMLAAPVVDAAAKEAGRFAANPWDYIADLLIELGTILLLVATAMGFVGYYLKAYSVKAKGDAAQGIATVESVFGNVSFDATQQPYLTVTTPNIANDVSNLGNDAWRFLQNTGSQAWADLKGIATAVDDIPKALVQLVSQGPGIAINGFLGLVSEALGDIFILLFPYGIIFGGAMLAMGAGMRAVRWMYDSYVRPEVAAWVDEHIGKPTGDWFHRLLSTAQVHAPTKSSVEGPTAPPARAAAGPSEGVGAGSTPGTAPPPETPPAAVPAVVGTAPVAPEAPEPVPSPPDAPTGPGINSEVSSTPRETLPAVPTEDQEQSLGDQLITAKDRLRAAIRRRRDGPAQEDYVAWAYARIPASA